ncbi:MAG TPA: ABC transporter permease, partial [Puia sp.]
MKENISIQTDTWQRLKKNRGAVFGMIIITLSLIMAVFSYFLAPDHSPYANRMVLEIGGQKPGYRQRFLLIKKQQEVIRASFLHRLISGRDDRYDWIPISSWSQSGDSLIVGKLIDESIVERQSFFHPPQNQDLKIRTKVFWLGTDRYGRDILSRL